jgi:hypothetical protein
MNLHLFSSQPKSVHGAGTVRYWAAVNVTIAQCRHNVSARDGGITASRRSGAGDFFLFSPLRAFPRMRHPQACGAFFHPAIHSSADAAMHPAGDSPSFHGPAAAAVRLLFYNTGHPLKYEISNPRLQKLETKI